MKHTPDDSSALERFIDRACREQPLRRAPAALSRNVLAELARRAALPWWHRSFSHWPAVVRIAFVLACVLVLLASLNLTVWAGAEHAAARLSTPIDQPLTSIRNIGAWATFIGSLFAYVGSALMQLVPTRLLEAGLVALAALYALLGGLGATGYRILYATR